MATIYFVKSEFVVMEVMMNGQNHFSYRLVFLFLGVSCFRGYGRRNGERRRKSVRGCIVSPDLSVLNLVIVKQGMHITFFRPFSFLR